MFKCILNEAINAIVYITLPAPSHTYTDIYFKSDTNDKRRKLAFALLYYYFNDDNTGLMAFSNSSVMLHKVRGAIGKQIVVKQYGNKTVITAYPDMSDIKPSKLQKLKRKKFAAAIEYARSIINDPVKKETYAKKLKKRRKSL